MTGRIKALRRKGFTIAELLTVVAIIAVLVAVGIPVFGTSLERSRAAACMANRRSLQSELSYAYMTEGESFTRPDISMYTCPSGGTISYTLESGRFKVECSVHSSWTSSTVPNAFEKVFKGYSGSSIDSTAKTADDKQVLMLTEAKKKLAAAGIDLSAIGAQSWSLANDGEGQYLLWSTVDIATLTPDQTVPVIRYRNEGTYQGQYSVWETKVGSITANGATYNKLNNPGSAQQLTASAKLSAEEKKDVATIKKIYNDYAAANGLPLIV